MLHSNMLLFLVDFIAWKWDVSSACLASLLLPYWIHALSDFFMLTSSCYFAINLYLKLRKIFSEDPLKMTKFERMNVYTNCRLKSQALERGATACVWLGATMNLYKSLRPHSNRCPCEDSFNVSLVAQAAELSTGEILLNSGLMAGDLPGDSQLHAQVISQWSTSTGSVYYW